ncbi:hypothetical protein [Paenibacillus assamensis]|uniref:hypothetical protein n=1 Tax=Paenibacillus assamensis TaxID=311244 RepID=UPI0003F7E29F|nr:hypothetical protein [Paenibacillus assamensis]
MYIVFQRVIMIILLTCMLILNGTEVYASSPHQYRYDENGHLIEMISDDVKIKYTNDVNGNLISQSVLKNFVIPPANLLTNANFSNGNTEIADKWKKSLWEATHSTYKTEIAHNQNIQKISTSNVLKDGFAGVSQAIPVTPGKSYIVNSSLAIDHLQNAKVQLYVDFFGSNGEWIGTDRIDHQDLTQGWFVTLSSSGIVPVNSKTARVYVLIRAVDDNAAGAITIRGASFS